MSPTAPASPKVTSFFDPSGRGAVVCATTAWNGLGESPHQIWAFRRAEIAAHAETPFRLADGQTATMLHIRTLPPRSQGLDRMAPVLRGLVSPLFKQVAAFGPRTRLATVMALAERFSDGGRPNAGARRLEAMLLGEAKSAGLEPIAQSICRGHASLAFALPAIASALTQGQLEAAVVGGVDTYYDAEVIDALVAQRRIFDGKNLEGFVPGEGGAFLLLARADVARRAGLNAAACVEGVAFAEEPAAIDEEMPLTAEALTRVIRALCDPLEQSKRNVDWWLSDVTHERDRVREWQLAFPRATAGVSTPDSTVDLLPPFLGDLGAATLPTAIAIAIEGFTRGDPPARTCLATASSAGASRGAVLMSSRA